MQEGTVTYFQAALSTHIGMNPSEYPAHLVDHSLLTFLPFGEPAPI